MTEDLNSKLKHYRISEDEYQLICEKLGRPPEGVEWALFSALWSEHCSYKSSKVHLKKFYSQSKRVVEGFGENAGVIDLGQGERVAFKMESHNHPSYIEPYEGAATGVGGILRDIFTMGARPIALANFLCFGEPKAEKMDHLVDGVVRGIGGYGNCVGVPTVTGQTEFHSSYNGNILVNAFAMGYFGKDEKVFTSQARGVGNFVVYVGAKTGRDGVHGASMASESFDEDSEAKKPTIQKGDPFYEKLLIEACIEVMNEGLVVAIQDMGAAGISSSSFEMASKGEVGLKLNLDAVPLRDSSMTPEDILLSESQERMLLICEPGKIEKLQKHFERWNLDAAVIGEITEKETVDLFWHNEKICSITPQVLVDDAPSYERPYKAWETINKTDDPKKTNPRVTDAKSELLQALRGIEGCDRKWIYKQYDQRVGGHTARDAEEPVAVLSLPESKRWLGLVLGCRPYMMRWDIKEGAKDAVAYPSLELASKGFEPLAVTDCLNFGNPEKEDVMGEFVTSVEAMSEMCEAFDAPVISGNVSLYNETLGKNITSTPATGLVGLREDMGSLLTSSFQDMEQRVFLLSLPMVQHSGLLGEKQNGVAKGLGEINSSKMAEFLKAVRELALQSGVTATRVVGKYGLPYALARMCTPKMGAHVEEGPWLGSKAFWPHSLFQERYYEVLFTVSAHESEAFKSLWEAKANGLKEAQLMPIGYTKPNILKIGSIINLSCEEVINAYKTPWEGHFEDLA